MESGFTSNGLPYNRFGTGPNHLIVFQGLQFENKPLSGIPARFILTLYGPLGTDYTVHAVGRRPGLPVGCTTREMADDYAAMIKQQFDNSPDVIGLSTGGLIAQHFAADHGDLVRRLVIHSSAHRLSDPAREFQTCVRDLAQARRWNDAYKAILTFMSPGDGIRGRLAGPAIWLVARFGRFLFGRPADPSDLIVTYDATNSHEFKDRLSEIKVPTLVLAGDGDPFYSPQLFRETSEEIPDARLVLYEGMGHPASGKLATRDMLEFLRQ